jgi:putative ABC transport system permease protein
LYSKKFLKNKLTTCFPIDQKLDQAATKSSPTGGVRGGSMLRNYFKIALRNLMKYKFISFINLFGLTVGLTCCLLILIYIFHELSYDKYHAKADRIYRVTRQFNTEDGNIVLHLGTISPPFGPLLVNDFPEIEKLTRLLSVGPTALRYGDKLFNEPDVYFADENLFDVFDIKVIKGNPKTALTDPFHVMLTEEIAKKYFGDEDPINKEIRFDNQQNVKVSGIYKAFPTNTHMHPSILISFNTLKDSTIYGEENLRTNWGNNSFFTYLLMPEHYSPKKMEALFPSFLDKHMSREYSQPGTRPSQFTKLFLQKLTDIHLRSHLDYEAEENGDIKRVYIFSAIALFILLIACINYMNLSTARSALRAREIGIRKVVGARRKEIIAQFLSESVLLVWIAIILAFGLTWLTLPWLNILSGQHLEAISLWRWDIILSLLLVPIVVGIVSGIYPALFMSAFQPVMVLKGLIRVGTGNISFRKVLVTVQFAISIILIISTIVIFSQLRYMQRKDLGYDKNHIINMNYVGALNAQYNSFRNELLQNAAVKDIARSSRIPTGRLLDDMGAYTMVGDSMEPTKADIKFVNVDYDFVPAYGIKMASGRNFSRSFGTDTLGYILNEAAVDVLGWKTPSEAIGKPFRYGQVKGQIIGVMRDFHFESMHEKIVPLVLIMRPPSQAFYGNISVKISGNNLQAGLAHVEKTWHKYLPELPYQYTFLDEKFNRLYQAEMRQGSIFTIFAFIAIFIACLGLFGLSAFAITQRIKEIGIRKVLGASPANLVRLLSADFMKLVVLAAILAFPVAWFMMDSWLQDFAYRISISWWVFLFAGIVAAIIALITISFQALKAAWTNPVNSLRTE